jgi:hypothetical protein
MKTLLVIGLSLLSISAFAKRPCTQQETTKVCNDWYSGHGCNLKLDHSCGCTVGIVNNKPKVTLTTYCHNLAGKVIKGDQNLIKRIDH